MAPIQLTLLAPKNRAYQGCAGARKRPFGANQVSFRGRDVRDVAYGMESAREDRAADRQLVIHHGAEVRTFDLASHSGERVHGVLVNDLERQRGGKRKLVVAQLNACGFCAGRACTACRDRGYFVEETFVKLKFTPSDVGHVVRIRAQGDVLASGARGDLVVHLTTDSREVPRFEARDQVLSASQQSWVELRGVRRRAQIRRRKRLLSLISVVLVALLGAGAIHYVRKAPVGDPCQTADDCRSGFCASSLGMTDQFAVISKAQCAKPCEKDDDCPGTMTCATPIGAPRKLCTPSFAEDRSP